MPSKLCDSSPAVSANAHVITNAEAREASSCFLCAFKRSGNICHPRITHIKNHLWARLSLSLLTLGWKWIFARCCAPKCLQSSLNLYNYRLFSNFNLNQISFYDLKKITSSIIIFIKFNKGTMYNAIRLGHDG